MTEEFQTPVNLALDPKLLQARIDVLESEQAKYYKGYRVSVLAEFNQRVTQLEQELALANQTIVELREQLNGSKNGN